jgi:hypothetical protein
MDGVAQLMWCYFRLAKCDRGNDANDSNYSMFVERKDRQMYS